MVPEWCYKNRYKSLDKIRRVRQPTLFLSGRSDTLIPPTHMDSLYLVSWILISLSNLILLSMIYSFSVACMALYSQPTKYTVTLCTWSLAQDQLWLDAVPNTTNDPSVIRTTDLLIVCQRTSHWTTAAVWLSGSRLLCGSCHGCSCHDMFMICMPLQCVCIHHTLKLAWIDELKISN